MKGFYWDVGISGGEDISVGGDLVINKQGEIVGIVSSVGVGVGSSAEGHIRAGITETLTLIKSKGK